MNPSIDNNCDINLKSLEHLIREEQRRLKEDKLRLQRNIENIKKRRSDGNHNQPFNGVTLPKDTLKNGSSDDDNLNEKIKEKYIPTDNSKVFMIKSSREEEISKLIDKISKPKEQQSFTSIKKLRRSYPQAKSDTSLLLCPVNLREREKDNLSEKFASSEYPLTKPSYRQIGKNLCSSISFNNCKQNSFEKAIDKELSEQSKNYQFYNEGEKSIKVDEDREEYLREKYNHPRIVISHYKETDSYKDTGNLSDTKMVRIGEFSPLNPNLPGGATVLGLGDWDERRQFLLEKYRQVSRSPSPSPGEGDIGHNHRSIATQTELDNDWSSNITLERSPREHQTIEKSTNAGLEHGREDKCISPQCRLSPIPKCFENMTEKEIKEIIYRQELEKQIEEKYRLKEEMKKKEAEEEAKIEAKIQKDLEKMRRQYEEEKLYRLDLAIRKREQEDLLGQKLAIEQQKAMQENKIMRNRPMKDLALQNAHNHYEKSTQSDFETSLIDNYCTRAPYSRIRVPNSRSLPDQSAASALSCVHEELRQPLLQPTSNLLSTEELENFLPDKTAKNTTRSFHHKSKKSSQKPSKSPPISVPKSKEVDILAQKAVFDTNVKSSPRINNITSFHSDAVKDKLKEVDNILKQPLLPESQRVLPPVSQPLIHATIPPLSASLQAPRAAAPTASNRTNCDILEDKWKVPYVELDSEADADTKHRTRILTQLGTFRRQLQEESLRMRQRVREDSP